jgi:uncharacterized surface protein with fasciclin (FAS1) repeats
MGRYDTSTFEFDFRSGRKGLASAPTYLKFKGGIIYPIDDVLNIPRGVSYELNNKAANATNFLLALGRAGLLEEVESLDQVTIFAPEDSAFQTVENSIDSLSKADLTAMLKYHIVPNNISYSTGLKNGTTFETMEGQDIKINIPRRTFIQNARVVQTDVLVKNGVVHIIDQVMSPKFTPVAKNITAGDSMPAYPTGTGFS